MLQHGQTLLRGSPHHATLQWSLSGRDEYHPIQSAMLKRILCRHKMPEVHRVKAPAKKTDFHGANKTLPLKPRKIDDGAPARN